MFLRLTRESRQKRIKSKKRLGQPGSEFLLQYVLYVFLLYRGAVWIPVEVCRTDPSLISCQTDFTVFSCDQQLGKLNSMSTLKLA